MDGGDGTSSAPSAGPEGAPASRGRLLLAHPDARDRVGVAVARERRDRPRVAETRKVSVARARADGPVHPRGPARIDAVTRLGAHVPVVAVAGQRSAATVLGDGAVVRGTGSEVHATVLPYAALVAPARGDAP